MNQPKVAGESGVGYTGVQQAFRAVSNRSGSMARTCGDLLGAGTAVKGCLLLRRSNHGGPQEFVLYFSCLV